MKTSGYVSEIVIAAGAFCAQQNLIVGLVLIGLGLLSGMIRYGVELGLKKEADAKVEAAEKKIVDDNKAAADQATELMKVVFSSLEGGKHDGAEKFKAKNEIH
jgi:hypothetical protein